MTPSETANRLILKLDGLRKLDRKLESFGAGPPFGHGYKSRKISPSALEAWERENCIALPPEYREWMQIVGMGAGPDYGLFPLSKITPSLYDLDERGFGGTVESPSAITMDHIHKALIKFNVTEENIDTFISSNTAEGLLVISESGCGAYTGIMLAGPLSGKVFAIGMELCEPDTALCALHPEGVIRWSRNEAGASVRSIHPDGLFGFYGWYEYWLDRGIAERLSAK